MSEKEIGKKLKSRVDNFKDVIRQLNETGKIIGFDYDYKSFTEWLNDYARTFVEDERYRAKRLELNCSCVGTRDYFLFFENETIEYHYIDYYDDVKIKLWGGDYELMSNIREGYLDYW